MARKAITPEIGEVIELMYPETYGRALAEFVGVSEYSVRHYVKTRKLQKGRNRKPIGYTTLYSQRRLVVKVNDDHPQQHHRFAFAHVLAWEKAAARKVPSGHVIVNLDGDRFNLDPDNLYCLPRRDLLNWARFVMQPAEVKPFLNVKSSPRLTCFHSRLCAASRTRPVRSCCIAARLRSRFFLTTAPRPSTKRSRAPRTKTMERCSESAGTGTGISRSVPALTFF